MFAISKGGSENETEEGMPDIDEAKLEKAMESMAGEMDGINEDDPKQVAGMMRKLYDSTGLSLGSGMEEAISRMESGEDPDKIGEEMGDVLEQEDPFSQKSKKGMVQNFKKKFLPPSIDETLYEL